MASNGTIGNLTYRAATTHDTGSPRNWQYEVWLNGERLPDCFAADDHEGWADCHVMGKATYLRDSLGVLKTERLTGYIEIRQVNTDQWPTTTEKRAEQRQEFFAALDAEKQSISHALKR